MRYVISVITILVIATFAYSGPNCHCTSTRDCPCIATQCTCFPCGKGPQKFYPRTPESEAMYVNACIRRGITVNQRTPQGNNRVQIQQGPLGAVRNVQVDQQQYPYPQQPQRVPYPVVVEGPPRLIQMPQYNPAPRRIEVEIVPAIRMIEGMPYIEIGPNQYIATPENLVQRQPRVQIQIQPQVQMVPQVQYVQPPPPVQIQQLPAQQYYPYPPQQQYVQQLPYPPQQQQPRQLPYPPRYAGPIYDGPIFNPPQYRQPSNCPTGNCPLR